MAFVTGTTTNAMLDAINITTTYATTNCSRFNLDMSSSGVGVCGNNSYVVGITKNAYLDSTAKSVGYAVIDGNIGKYSGVYWNPIADNTKVLSGDFKVQVNVSDIGGVANNGLIYTADSGVFSTLLSLGDFFSVTLWVGGGCNYVNKYMNNYNPCASRGMLLPTYEETQVADHTSYNPCSQGGSSAGIPNLTFSFFMTSSANGGTSNYCLVGSDNSLNVSPYSAASKVRCVR